MDFLYKSLLLLVGVIDVVIALLVFARDPLRLNNRAFAVFAFSMGGWILGILAFLVTSDDRIAMIWVKAYYTFPLLIALSGVYFALSFPQEQKVRNLAVPLAWIGFLSLELPLLFANGFMVQGIVHEPWGKVVQLSSVPYSFYTLYIIGFFGFILYVMFRKSRALSGFNAQHARLFFNGLTISAILGMFFNLILPLLGDYQLIHLGPLFNSFAVMFLGFAIVRHRMFDIRLVVARSLAYLLTVTVMAGLFGFIVFSITSLAFEERVSIQFQIFVSLMTAMSALLFVALKKFFDRVTNKLFYRDAYDSQEFLDHLNRVLVTSTDIDVLLGQTAALIASNLKSQFCYFVLRETSYVSERVVGEINERISANDQETLRAAIQRFHTRLIVADDIADKDPELYGVMRKYSIAVIARLVTTLKYDVGGMGYLAVGDKRSGNPLSKQDVDVIRIIANELVIAVQNALRFEEIEKFNVTLQEKIDDSTKRLRKTNDKLKALDETKDEFISMASHQLRTPLTSVKGYLSMVLEGDAGELNETQRKMLGQAFTSSQRMVYLIADLLNLSRLRTGKFVIDSSVVNLADVIAGEIEQLREAAATRNLELEYEKPKDFPLLMMDETKMRQVLMNFIDNAIYYTPAGGHIRINLVDKKESVEMTVVDDGIGVPKAEQHHLFNKFYRAGNARKARPDGTGLGLFMAKKVVVAQGGAIIFTSREGKGSTFGFSFSKHKLAVPADTAAPAPQPEAAAVS